MDMDKQSDDMKQGYASVNLSENPEHHAIKVNLPERPDDEQRFPTPKQIIIVLYTVSVILIVIAFMLWWNCYDRNIIGKGVDPQYLVKSTVAEWKITGCPAYGDKSKIYVYGSLTKGNPSDYEIITLVKVDGNYYGKKPYHLPRKEGNTIIKPNGNFKVQFNANDGKVMDHIADEISLFLVHSGYKDEIVPDINAGYVIPVAQILSLIKNSVCVVNIERSASIK